MPKNHQQTAAWLNGTVQMAQAVLLLLMALPGTLYCQLEVAGQKVEIHGFVSQGFAVSEGNNYLTMNTRDGSFALTDGGLNASSQITSKFRVGAQLYVENIGHLGDWHPELDWAFGDYRFRDWFGVRAGKVKTTLGLYTDTQDEGFLTTWAILPQSIYPLDLRTLSIAHTGVDLYGNISLKDLGTLSYVAYTGLSPNDNHGGYVYGLKDYGTDLRSYVGRMEGADVRWNTPVRNLLVGASYLIQNTTGKGTGADGGPHLERSRANETSQYYVQYSLGNLRLDAEYRRFLREELIFDSSPYVPPEVIGNSRGFYGSAAYSLSNRWEIGSYYSLFVANWNEDLSPPGNHIADKVATVRFNFDSHFNVKLEGHFISGYGGADSLRGFYSIDNPAGLKPHTNMLVVRLGYNF